MTMFQKLVAAHLAWASSLDTKPEGSRIQVDGVAAKVAAFYERIRSVVGWTEEHLLRKAAIARIVRRAIFVRDVSNQPLAEMVVKHLIRGGYFRNNVIPETVLPHIDRVLARYLFLFSRIESFPMGKQRVLREWLFGILGCEIEAFLDEPVREEALLNFATEQLGRRILVSPPLPEREHDLLLFIAVRQALFKLDEPIITYQLLKRFISRWTELSPDTDAEGLERFAADLWRWYNQIHGAFTNPTLEKFYWAVEALDTPYLILGDALTEAARENRLTSDGFSSPDELEALAFNKYQVRLRQQRRKSLRAAMYSTASIFLSKVAIAFAIEIPFDKWIGQFSMASLWFNIAIPPVLMVLILLVGFGRIPRGNAAKVVMGVSQVVADAADPYQLKRSRRHSFLLRSIVTLFYLAGAAVTLGALVYVLTWFKLSILSQAIFIFFISLIAFAGTRIRARSRELVIDERPPGFFHDLFLFFTFPIVEVGRWFSGQLRRIRFLDAILDLIVELPMHFFIEFIEQWRAFMRERKQEVH